MNYLKVLPILSIFAFPAMAMAQYPIIFNHVKYVSISQETCIRRAEIAAKDSGFDSNFEPLALSGAENSWESQDETMVIRANSIRKSNFSRLAIEAEAGGGLVLGKICKIGRDFCW